MSETEERRRSELAAFLKARRSRRQPEDAGLVRTGYRRTPGLRREEVAVLANIGVSWYSWLEQGRPIKASAQVVNAISDALGLDQEDRAHLRVLAGLHEFDVVPVSEERVSRIVRDVQLVIDNIGDPAYILDKYGSVEFINAAARELIYAPIGSNCMIRFFTDADYADRFVDQDAAARSLVGRFRKRVGKYIDDSILAETVDSLLMRSDSFASLWREMAVGSDLPEVLVYRHDSLGQLPMRTTSFALEADMERTLVVHSVDGPMSDVVRRHLQNRSCADGRVIASEPTQWHDPACALTSIDV
ncbi:helix-turn-helix domain-containing protein [Nocardia sp. BSTN01]|uniref:helix-turn-helix transcriptional regulator n=1 Tax=Nocardia sp. BSTN01 TaxID=2783665 RepID=UPI00188DD4F6|nr:helix-turn-helix transcriptional regulator [Nocardia sp. BSTN01]MBF4998289.1 helix-turn-helix domain-containing protein [Nocardia sp. BSTN01]